MTRLDHVVTEALSEMAGEVSPTDFVQRAHLAARQMRNRRRRIAAGSLALLAISGVALTAVLPGATKAGYLAAPPSVLDVDSVLEGTPKRIAMLMTFDRVFGTETPPPVFIALDADTRQFVRLPSDVSSANQAPADRVLSADGQAIVTLPVGQDATVLTLADMRSTKIEFEPCPGIPPASHDYDFELSPDSKRYAVTRDCDASGEVQIFDLATRKPVGGPIRLPVDGFLTTKWSPDGARLVTATRTSSAIVDAASGAVIRSLPPSMGGRWSADGHRLLTSMGPADAMHPVVVDVRSGAVQEVTLLPDGLFPIGWDTPDRLVWGRFGDEQGQPAVLVTANLDGTDVRDWLRIEGSHRLDEAQWTTELSR